MLRKTDMNNNDQQFLDYVVKSLVNNHNDVKIARTVDEMGVLMTLDASLHLKSMPQIWEKLSADQEILPKLSVPYYE